MYQVSEMRTPTPDRTSPASNGGRRTPTGRRSPRSYYERTTTVRFVLPSTGRAMCTKLNRVQRTKARIENNTCLCENFLRGHCDFGGNCLLAHVPKQYLWDFLTPSVNRDTYTYEKGFNIRCYTPSLDAYYDMPSEWIYVTRGSERYVEMYNDNGDNFKDKCKLCDDLQRTGCCQRGGECEDIHCCCADISQFPCIHTHTAELEAIKHYPRLDKNIVVRVYLPNSSEESQEFTGDDVIRTAGATQYEEAYMRENGIPSVKMQHCAHFQNKKLCRLGDGCRFLHVISLALSTPMHEDDDGYLSSSLRNSPVDDRLSNPQRRNNKNTAATLAISSMMTNELSKVKDNYMTDSIDVLRERNALMQKKFMKPMEMADDIKVASLSNNYNLNAETSTIQFNNMNNNNNKGNTVTTNTNSESIRAQLPSPAKLSPTCRSSNMVTKEEKFNQNISNSELIFDAYHGNTQYDFSSNTNNANDTNNNCLPTRTSRPGNPAAAPSRVSPPKVRISPNSIESRFQQNNIYPNNTEFAENNINNTIPEERKYNIKYTNESQYCNEHSNTHTSAQVNNFKYNTSSNMNSNCKANEKFESGYNELYSKSGVYGDKYENNVSEYQLNNEVIFNENNTKSTNNENYITYNNNIKNSDNDFTNNQTNNLGNFNDVNSKNNYINTNQSCNNYYTQFPSQPQQVSAQVDFSCRNVNTRTSPTGKDRVSPTRRNNPYSLSHDTYTTYEHEVNEESAISFSSTTTVNSFSFPFALQISRFLIS